jgi:hypothetical protein
MPLSTDISLPKSVTARFPDRCIVCGRAAPESTVKITTRSIGWWTWAFHWPGEQFSVHVPSCVACGWRLQIRRWGGTFVMIAILGTVAIWLGPWIYDVAPKPVRRWLTLGALLVSLIPYFVWELLVPPPIELTAYSRTVDYEFKDRQYAGEFIMCNAEHLLAMDDPEGAQLERHGAD